MTETHRLPMRLGSLVAEWLLGTQLAEKTLPSLRLGNGAGSALSPGAVFRSSNQWSWCGRNVHRSRFLSRIGTTPWPSSPNWGRRKATLQSQWQRWNRDRALTRPPSSHPKQPDVTGTRGQRVETMVPCSLSCDSCLPSEVDDSSFGPALWLLS